ncbi:MAG: glycosyl hydrolase, partial [Myxococcota bacterium]
MQRRVVKRKAAQGIRSKRRPARAAPQPSVILLVGTRKGAFVLRGNGARTRWRTEGPHRFGEIVNHLVLDPRDQRTLLCAARAGHLGPTIYRSSDFGATWKEATQPPAFRKAAPGEPAFAVDHTFFLA